MIQDPYTLEIKPGVARRWDHSRDGTRITFHLHPEARWSNGEPLTAEDFVWSWHRALHPRTGNQLAGPAVFCAQCRGLQYRWP